MTLDEQTEKRVYEKLRAFDGLEVAGHAPVKSSIASVLSEGEVLADNGEQYSSIQQAVDVSDGFVFVGPGTYYENVVIDKDDFTLQGAGYDTLIDGGTTGNAITSSGTDVTMSSLSIQTEAGSGTASDGINATGSISISKVVVRDCDRNAFSLSGNDTTVRNCTVEDTDGIGFSITGERSVVSNCKVLETGAADTGVDYGFDINADDVILANSHTTGNVVGTSVFVRANDGIAIGNIVPPSTSYDIRVDGTDNIIANNRAGDISNAGTGTITDGNLTGAFN